MRDFMAFMYASIVKPSASAKYSFCHAPRPVVTWFGQIALAVMPYLPSSIAVTRVSPLMPCFDEQYAEANGKPDLAAWLAMLTMRPPRLASAPAASRCLIIWIAAYLVHKNAPRKFTPSTASHSSIDMSIIGFIRYPIPALFTRISRPP